MHRHSITARREMVPYADQHSPPKFVQTRREEKKERKKGWNFHIRRLIVTIFSIFASSSFYISYIVRVLKISKNLLREKQAGYFFFTRAMAKEREPRSAAAFPGCFLIHTAARYDHLSKELAGIILSELPRGGGPRFMKHSVHHKQGLATYGYHRRTTGPTDARSSVGDSEKCSRNYWIGNAHDIISG